MRTAFLQLKTQQITGEISAHLYSEVGLQALITTGAYNINASEDL